MGVKKNLTNKEKRNSYAELGFHRVSFVGLGITKNKMRTDEGTRPRNGNRMQVHLRSKAQLNQDKSTLFVSEVGQELNVILGMPAAETDQIGVCGSP